MNLGVPDEQQAEVLAVADEIVHRSLGRLQDVLDAVIVCAVLAGDHRQRPPRGSIRRVVVVEESIVQLDVIAAVVARIAAGGDERLDGYDGPLEVPAQVAQLPLRVGIAERDEGAVEARLVCILISALAVLVHTDRHIDVCVIVHQGVGGVEVIREAVVGRCEVDNVPEGLELRSAAAQHRPGVLHAVRTGEHREGGDIIPVHIGIDEIRQRPRRAVLLAGEGVEVTAEAAVERDGVGVAPAVGVHRIEPAVAGLQDAAVVVVEDERRLACRVEVRTVIAAAEQGAAVQAEDGAEKRVIPAGAGEVDLLAGRVHHGRRVAEVLACPVVENERVIAEVHLSPGDV